jgi:hypothetical protein
MWLWALKRKGRELEEIEHEEEVLAEVESTEGEEFIRNVPDRGGVR